MNVAALNLSRCVSFKYILPQSVEKESVASRSSSASVLPLHVVKIPKLSIPHFSTGPVSSSNPFAGSSHPHSLYLIGTAPVRQNCGFRLENVEATIDRIEA